MPRPDKVTDVAELTNQFRSSSAAVLTEYRGLTVAQLTQLRNTLGSTTQYTVVKNTLSKIAVRDAGLDGLTSLLQGPSAIAFVQGDPVEAAKGLRDFAKAHPLLVIKGGVLDGKLISAAEIAKIADLESREVLLAKVAGAATASLSKAAALFQAPLSQVARLAEALRAKTAESAPAEATHVAEATTDAEVSSSTNADTTEAGTTDADAAPAVDVTETDATAEADGSVESSSTTEA